MAGVPRSRSEWHHRELEPGKQRGDLRGFEGSEHSDARAETQPGDPAVDRGEPGGVIAVDDGEPEIRQIGRHQGETFEGGLDALPRLKSAKIAEPAALR